MKQHEHVFHNPNGIRSSDRCKRCMCEYYERGVVRCRWVQQTFADLLVRRAKSVQADAGRFT